MKRRLVVWLVSAPLATEGEGLGVAGSGGFECAVEGCNGLRVGVVAGFGGGHHHRRVESDTTVGELFDDELCVLDAEASEGDSSAAVDVEHDPFWIGHSGYDSHICPLMASGVIAHRG